jgi:hypothetical protein
MTYYECLSCGWLGDEDNAIVHTITQHHPYGMGFAEEYLIDSITCPSCGGEVVETDDPDTDSIDELDFNNDQHGATDNDDGE